MADGVCSISWLHSCQAGSQTQPTALHICPIIYLPCPAPCCTAACIQCRGIHSFDSGPQSLVGFERTCMTLNAARTAAEVVSGRVMM